MHHERQDGSGYHRGASGTQLRAAARVLAAAAFQAMTQDRPHRPGLAPEAASAASLGEGLEDMFTVRRLGVGGRLAASLTNTNCIESMISIARDTTKNVKRWRDGKMIKRWCAAGMLNAENSFRRLKGYRQMPTFVAALARHVEAVTPACDAARVA
jgi:HD domain-containing protein